MVKQKFVPFVLAFTILTTGFTVIPPSQDTVEAKTAYVYIAKSGRGECYHLDKECSRMRGNVKKVKLSKVTKLKRYKHKKYRACSKCYG